ncbi:MAG: MBL fold metallo-hydrolase [Candidatus Omnitrophica bacterium]|nr:MBL fold metallo-hydrolase [Candidatus Omnitrophota bacterium]MCM8825803.1 MBL fold metallo-hydrolase [Candidatus Omnitrophota bacterium]
MNLLSSEFSVEKIVVGELQTNCYIISSKKNEAVIIDPGAWPEKIISCVRRKSLNVRYIFNTHGHYDHTGANCIKLLLESNPLLCIHRMDTAYLSDRSLNLPGLISTDCVFVPPDIFLRDGQVIECGEGLNFKVIHTPGHTPGSICLLFENYLFSGDLLFSGAVGRTDLIGGDEVALIKSLKKISRLKENTVVLPGHGPNTTIGYEIATNPYISLDENND